MKVGSSGGPVRPQPTREATGASRVGRVQRSDAVSAYGAGDSAVVSEPRAIEDRIEILGLNPADLSPRVKETMMDLFEEVDSLKRELYTTNMRLRELEDLADMDPLLPIRNRRAFVRELQRMMSFAQRYETPSTVMFIDMNDMKKINDEHGHEAGDHALFHLAQLISDNIRNTDVVGRLGGDEFGVILAQADELVGREKAEALANEITSIPLMLDSGEQISLRFAYGIYTFRGNEEVAEALEKADQAMYAHKKALKGDNIR